MPTGYTAAVKDGKVTDFSEFARQCARAFGAAIHQRDESASASLRLREEDDYHYEWVERDKKKLEEALARTDEEWAALQDESIALRIRQTEESIQKRSEDRARYELMLAKAKNWTPPTEEHEGLKKFMIEQLVDSIKFDCPDPDERFDRFPTKISVDEYKAQEISRLRESLARSEAGLREHQANVAGANQWIKDLEASLNFA
jgi:hypothetical protein